MAMVVFYFQHDRTPQLSIAGRGPNLPVMTHLRLEVDETKNPPGAPALHNSYLIKDPFGFAIELCYFSTDLKTLGDTLGYLVWCETGRPAKGTKFVLTKIYHSDFHFTALGELSSVRIAA